MSVFKKAIVSATAASLAIVPAVASAADASQVRAGATVVEGEEAVGGGGIIVGVLAAAAVIAGIIIIADGDNDNDDDSDSN